ncbi:MAG TPA: class I SAM-dependent methyltransferase [Acidiferrobacteraceae bacterium]|nr:class I SAM-dependent methyltransferase [Acidiferrobacteraceae bacterium]
MPLSTEAQKNFYDEIYKEYNKPFRSPYTRDIHFFEFGAGFQTLTTKQHGDMLEIGCASGLFAKYFSSHAQKYTGCDISERQLGLARRNLNDNKHKFISADGKCLPFLDESYDIVVTSGVLHHIDDRDKIYAEVYRVLRPGGVFICFEPAAHNPVANLLRVIAKRLHPMFHPDEVSFTQQEIEDAFRQNNFSRFTVIFHMFILGYLITFNFKKNWFWDFIFGLLFRAERVLTRLPHNSPLRKLGISLIGIGYK